MKLIPTICIAAFAGALISTADARPRHRMVCKPKVTAKAKAKVNTPWEKRADTNDNGRVSPGERKDHHEVVQEKRVVDTDREERIDKNDDGVVGRHEAHRARHHRRAARAKR